MASALYDADNIRGQEAGSMTTLFTTQGLIDSLVRSMDCADPATAIRLKARRVIEQYCTAFDNTIIPPDVYTLASFLGIAFSEDPPVHSEDAELVPIAQGRVAMRVNPDRPETRRRFSVGHEVSHTFFSNYQRKAWCRTDARYRNRQNPDDLLEMLCDIGAAELILPVPWFVEDAADVSTGDGLAELARKYTASREATVRRFAENHNRCVAAVFLSWKLKPSQQGTIGNISQQDFFASDPTENARRAKKLRVDYSIRSEQFAEAGYYVPNDKSLENDGPLYHAASTGYCCEGDCRLDLGPSAGRYRVLAVPVWTTEMDVGPSGENGLCAIIEPLNITPRRVHHVNWELKLFG
jgi:hypothetical protein